MMKLVSHVHTKDKPTWKDKLIPTFICIFSLSKTYHSELLFSDGVTLTCDPSGVYFTKRVFDRYNQVELPIPWINKDQELMIRKEAEKIVASRPKYDWLGVIFGSTFNNLNDESKWFCSELCKHLLKPYTTTIREERWYSPNRLWYYVNQYLMKYDHAHPLWREQYK